MVYSLASPVRKMPETGEVVRSALKPIGEPYKSVALDTNKDVLVEAVVEPANEQEIADTVKVMGGQTGSCGWTRWTKRACWRITRSLSLTPTSVPI